MVVMRTFLGCFSVRSGTLGILIVTNLLLVGGIVFIGLNFNTDTIGDKWNMFISDESKVCTKKGEDDFHCKVIEIVKSKYILIAILVVASIFLISGFFGLLGYCIHCTSLLMVWLVAAFLILLAAFLVTVLTVTLQSLLLPRGEDNVYVVAKAIIQFAILLVGSYFWLCVVSYVQILKAMQKLGLNEVQNILNTKQIDDEDTGSIIISRSNISSPMHKPFAPEPPGGF